MQHQNEFNHLSTSSKMPVLLLPCGPRPSPFQESEHSAEPPNQETIEAAQEIAHDPRLMRRRIDLINRMGVAGERRAAGLTLTTLDSRLLQPNLNGDQSTLALKLSSAPGSGKSYIVGACISIQQPDQIIRISSASDKSLYHFGKSLKHRALILEEAFALQKKRDNELAYVIRQLVTEGKAVHLVTEPKGKRKFESVEKTIEGPISLVTTTILPDLEEQLDNRMITVSPDEGTKQTRAILKTTADLAAGKQIEIASATLNAWREFHAILKPARVVIPFADNIVKPLLSSAPLPTEARRSFKRVLSVVMAVAIAYQHQRSTDQEGRLVAEIADYHMAMQLIGDLFEEGVAEKNGLYHQRIDFIKAKAVQSRDLVKAWGLSKKTVSNLLKRACQDGLVFWCDDKGIAFKTPTAANAAKHAGKAFVKTTGKTNSAIGRLLPSPYDLTGRPEWRKGGRELERFNLQLN